MYTRSNTIFLMYFFLQPFSQKFTSSLQQSIEGGYLMNATNCSQCEGALLGNNIQSERMLRCCVQLFQLLEFSSRFFTRPINLSLLNYFAHWCVFLQLLLQAWGKLHHQRISTSCWVKASQWYCVVVLQIRLPTMWVKGWRRSACLSLIEKNKVIIHCHCTFTLHFFFPSKFYTKFFSFMHAIHFAITNTTDDFRWTGRFLRRTSTVFSRCGWHTTVFQFIRFCC